MVEATQAAATTVPAEEQKKAAPAKVSSLVMTNFIVM